MKKYLYTNKDVNLALLQIRYMPVVNGLPCSTTILFNKLITVLLPKTNRTPLLYDYDDEHYNTLKQRLQWTDNYSTQKDFTIIPIGSIVAVKGKMVVPGSTAHWGSMAPKSMITDPRRSKS